MLRALPRPSGGLLVIKRPSPERQRPSWSDGSGDRAGREQHFAPPASAPLPRTSSTSSRHAMSATALRIAGNQRWVRICEHYLPAGRCSGDIPRSAEIGAAVRFTSPRRGSGRNDGGTAKRKRVEEEVMPQEAVRPTTSSSRRCAMPLGSARTHQTTPSFSAWPKSRRSRYSSGVRRSFRCSSVNQAEGAAVPPSRYHNALRRPRHRDGQGHRPGPRVRTGGIDRGFDPGHVHGRKSNLALQRALGVQPKDAADARTVGALAPLTGARVEIGHVDGLVGVVFVTVVGHAHRVGCAAERDRRDRPRSGVDETDPDPVSRT